MEKVEIANTAKITAVIKDYGENGNEVGVTIFPNRSAKISKKAYDEQRREKIFSTGSLMLLGDSQESVEVSDEMTDEQIAEFLKRPVKEAKAALQGINSEETLRKIVERTNKPHLAKAANKRIIELT